MNANLPEIQLGSAGEEALRKDSDWNPNAKRIPMFSVDGLYPGFFSEKRTPSNYQCIILPSFDLTLSPEDSAYQESYMPCRFKDQFNRDGSYKFTGWYCAVWGYAYYGKYKSSFLSPMTRDKYTPDPLAEIYAYTAPKRDSDTRIKALFNYSGNGNKTLIAKPTFMRLVNIWGPATTTKSEDQGMKNRILCLKPMAFDKFVEDLNRTGTTDHVDKNWPNHIFGDPTDPERAILCSPKLYPSPTQGQNGFFGLYLGTTSFTRDSMHLEAQFTKITQEMLKGRYRLNKILYVPDYEEIMDLILSEGLIPRDIVEAACSKVPPERKTYVAPAPVVKEEPVFAPIPPAPAPTPAPVSTSGDDLDPADEARFREVQDLIRSGQGSPELVAEFRVLRDKIERVRGVIGY